MIAGGAAELDSELDVAETIMPAATPAPAPMRIHFQALDFFFTSVADAGDV